MVGEYRFVERVPTVEEFCELRARNGLTPKSAEAAARGLPNTIFAVVVEHEGKTIGMGRVIGDGGTAYQITDIAVFAEHRGQGLGKKIVAALVGWLRASAPKSAYVSLIADGPAKDLYAQYGFEETAPESVGMAMWIR